MQSDGLRILPCVLRPFTATMARSLLLVTSPASAELEFRRQWTRASDPLNFSKTTYQSQTIHNFKHAVNKGIHVLEHIIRVLK